MMKRSSPLRSFRTPGLTPLQRAGEVILFLGIMSVAGAFLALICVMFYLGLSKSALARFYSVTDLPFPLLAALALFWWGCLAIQFERQAANPATAPNARLPETRFRRMFVFAPFMAAIFSYLFFSLVLPVTAIAFIGKDIHLVVRVEKVGIETRKCTFALLAHPPVGADFERCVSSRLLGQLSPGDGLEFGARVWRAYWLPIKPRRVPPGEVWPDGYIPPEVARDLIEYDAAMKNLAGDR